MCNMLPVEHIKFDVDDVVAGFKIRERPDGLPWAAIAIGPESDVDRLIIIPGEDAAPSQLPGGLEGSVDRQIDIKDKTYPVSVKRPWIGPVFGPIRVLMPYAHAVVNDPAERLRPSTTKIWQQFSGRPRFQARVELLLYPFLPPWLPTERTPLDFPFRYPSFGATGGGETSVSIYIPLFGRKSLTLSIEADGIADGGSVDWSFSITNACEDSSLNTIIANAHALQPVTTELADFDRTYAWDGEADFGILTLAENAALPEGVTLSGVLKAWD